MPHRIRLLLGRPIVVDDVAHYRRQYRAIALLGLLAMVSGLAFFLDPGSLERSAVGRALHGPVDDLWSLFYAAGGAMVVAGVYFPRRWHGPLPALEASGLWLLLTALTVNGVAIVAVRGWAAGATIPTLAFAAWVAYGRVQDLYQLGRTADPGPSGPKEPAGRALGVVAFVVPFAASGLDLNAVVVALLGGGGVAAFAQFFLLPRNREGIIASASEKAAASAAHLLATYEQDNERLRDRVAELERLNGAHVLELQECGGKITRLEARIDQLEAGRA